MRFLICIALFAVISENAWAQASTLIRTYDFVEIINDQQEESMYYYDNNWKKLRQLAVAEGYIDSFEMHEVAFSENSPFHLILITTYTDDGQYEQREKNFDKLIAMRGELKLLNEKQPSEFRKFVFESDTKVHRRAILD